MSIKAEETIGVIVISALLLWVFSLKGGSSTSAPINNVTYNVPSFPASKITLPRAPDLNFITNQAGPTVNQFNVTMPTTPATTPAPCACSSCDEGGASMVTQTLNAFTASITKSLGTAYDTYVNNLQTVLTPQKILASFAGSSEAKANADLVMTAQQNAQKSGAGVNLTVGNVQYSASQETKDFRNIAGINGNTGPALQRAGNITLAALNQFTPGRQITLVG